MRFDPHRIDHPGGRPPIRGSRPAPSFEPRLVLPEPTPLDDQGELAFPGDLQALAERLKDDSAHLAHCYQADTEGRTSELAANAARWPRLRSRRLEVLTAVAAATAVAVSAAIFSTLESGDRLTPPLALQNERTTAESMEPSTPLTDSQAPIDTLAHDSLDASSSLHLLGGASGPEREALLDLWQQSASTETSISF